MNALYRTLMVETAITAFRIMLNLLAMPGLVIMEVLVAAVERNRNRWRFKSVTVLLTIAAIACSIKLMEVLVDGMIDIVAEFARAGWRMMRLLSIAELVLWLLSGVVIAIKAALTSTFSFTSLLVGSSLAIVALSAKSVLIEWRPLLGNTSQNRPPLYLKVLGLFSLHTPMIKPSIDKAQLNFFR